MKWLQKKEKKNELMPSLDEQRAEILAQLGGALRSTRESKGLSLEEMVYHTRVPQRLLRAIEEGKLSDLPEPIYIQGLTRQYANALGLNGAEFTSSFPLGSNKVNSVKPTWKGVRIGQLRPFHLYLMYIGLIAFSVSGLSQFFNDAVVQANNSQGQQKPATSPTAHAKPSESVQHFQLAQFSTGNIDDDQQVQVGVTLKASSYIRVVADGKIQYDGVLPEGSKQTWTAQKELTVKAGNAGGVLVKVNKDKPKQMGNLGEVQEMTIAANSRS
jgi:cytoskeletal protein RodZ